MFGGYNILVDTMFGGYPWEASSLSLFFLSFFFKGNRKGVDLGPRGGGGKTGRSGGRGNCSRDVINILEKNKSLKSWA